MFMGSPVSGNAPGQATLPPSTPSPSTGNVGSSGNANAAGGSQPVVSTQSKSKTNFFDIFLSEKQIKRNQKHAEVMAALKTYSKIEKQLKDVNDRLDKLISVLTIATEGGTKSLLLAAADEAHSSILAHSASLTNFSQTHAQKQLSASEISAFTEAKDALNKKMLALIDRSNKTMNFSEDVNKKISKVLEEFNKINALHTEFINRHKEIPKVPRQNQAPLVQNPDGGDSDDEPESED
jgi:hypothetical protein